MLGIGLLAAVGTGALQSPFGFLKIWKRLSVLVAVLSWKNCQENLLQKICIVNCKLLRKINTTITLSTAYVDVTAFNLLYLPNLYIYNSVDEITIPSKRPGQPPLRRIPEVFDCWFESGSMPYAQLHYPFENERNAIL